MAFRLDALTRTAFRELGRLRRRPAFHPVGVAYPATVEVVDGWLAPAVEIGVHPAVVRFSRGVGLPAPWPDIHGVAVRLLDVGGQGVHQDLLVSGVLPWGRVRMLPFPTRRLTGTQFSSIAPYDGPRGRVLLGARPLDRAGTLDDVEAAVTAGRFRWDLLAAEPRGRWVPIGAIEARPDRLDEDEELALGFDPWNTHRTLTPAGWLNRLRRPAYPASREGRRQAGPTPRSPATADPPGGTP